MFDWSYSAITLQQSENRVYGRQTESKPLGELNAQPLNLN